MSPARQQGLSLIEVLVTIVVVAIGLLGIAGMQSLTVQNNYLANQFTSASMQAQALGERMRANRMGVIDDDYALACGDIPEAPEVDCAAETCSPAQMAQWDLASWFAGLRGGDAVENTDHSRMDPLPDAFAEITCAAPCELQSLRNIRVCWNAVRSGAENDCQADAAAGIVCYALSVRP